MDRDMAIENKGLRGPISERVILHTSDWARTPVFEPIPNNRRRYSGLGQISRQRDAEVV
jgi:hypothetical protein